ncbi:hypothetical protein [Saccharothrix obliqua]|uniref:hypothetical protein n=1 Tax=Saccharothrix obliqua TaxID=2861747 RepID=UPI001C5F68B3|nr:hypothetical protein [Saccharothrix obliqua]MBW4722300.1 hypothetical protein [Saccharothrix obliqua]
MVAEPGDTAQQVIDRCRDVEVDAVRRVDGEEPVVQLHDVGPELWTEDALRRGWAEFWAAT